MFGCSIYSWLSYIFCCVAGNAGKKMSNAKYFTIYLIWMIFALVIEYLPSNSVSFITVSDKQIIDSNLKRYFGTAGIEIVYRVSCALVCSFTLLFFSTLAWPVTHHMFFGVFFLILIFFSWLFIWGIDSIQWMTGFRNIARVLSAIYLILQSLALVDFAFSLHEIISEKMEETNVIEN